MQVAYILWFQRKDLSTVVSMAQQEECKNNGQQQSVFTSFKQRQFKRGRQEVNAATSAPTLTACFSVNNSRPVPFLIDTGASISIIPPTLCSTQLLSPSSVSLLSVDNRPLKVFGECQVTLSNKALRRRFTWDVVVAQVSQPIVGIDFLSAKNIIVNCRDSTRSKV